MRSVLVDLTQFLRRKGFVSLILGIFCLMVEVLLYVLLVESPVVKYTTLGVMVVSLMPLVYFFPRACRSR